MIAHLCFSGVGVPTTGSETALTEPITGLSGDGQGGSPCTARMEAPHDPEELDRTNQATTA